MIIFDFKQHNDKLKNRGRISHNNHFWLDNPSHFMLDLTSYL